MNITQSFAAAILSVCVLAQNTDFRGKNPDGKKDFEQLAAENGFQSETFSVTTSDGYILNMWRIPGAIGEETGEDKPVIFMQHGVIDSAYCWMMNYPEVAPAFSASRKGYDVWLGNSRGNTFSDMHVKWDKKKDKKEYWNFSWAEMGLYDLPAMFDKVTEITGREKMAYIGHSMGTTQMFYALAETQDYIASKVSVFVSLAPILKLSHTDSKVLKFITHFYDVLDDASNLLGIYALF